MSDNPYLNHLQYRSYPDMSQDEISQNYYGAEPTASEESQKYMQTIRPTMSSQGIADFHSGQGLKYTPQQPQVQQPATPNQTPPGPSTGDAVNSSVNKIAGAVPVYGTYYAAARGAAGAVQNALPKDEKTGEIKGKFNQGLNEELTPLHETTIKQVSEGKWEDLAYNTLLGGQQGALKKWFS